MTGAPLPDGDHIARYCKPSSMRPDGLPFALAFRIREGEDYLSVNWLDYFQSPDLPAAVQHIREVFRNKGFRLGRRGAFVVLGVGRAKTRVQEELGHSLRFEHAPSRDDPSHAAIYGYGFSDTAVAAELAALIGPRDVYPAT